MKSFLSLIFVASLAGAFYLALDHFTEIKNEASPNSNLFDPNSIEGKVYADFSDLKKKNQLPSQIFDTSGIFVSDQRADRSTKLNRSIIEAIKSIVPQKGDGLFEIELIVFDTAENPKSFPSKNAKDKTQNLPPTTITENSLVFQFSIIEKKTKNKVAEFGRTYSQQ